MESFDGGAPNPLEIANRYGLWSYCHTSINDFFQASIVSQVVLICTCVGIMSKKNAPNFTTALISGGLAGTTVDIALFPLDTIKTRLQSPQGFLKAGGFRGVYKGLSAAAVGSSPGAALFFSTYEAVKHLCAQSETMQNLNNPAYGHMLAASLGEIMACLVRVPTEVVKQRMQAGMGGSSMVSTCRSIFQKEGAMGFYMGFNITVMREIPFSLVQFPLYEYMKSVIKTMQNGTDAYPYQAAICGSISGGLAAGITTPLDVLKTRLMLGVDAKGIPYEGTMDTFRRICQGKSLSIK